MGRGGPGLRPGWLVGDRPAESGHSLCAGAAFIFRNRAGNRLRLLLWDGLCQRRLHQGSFVWPKVNDAVFAISQAQWQWLIAGVNWQRLSAKPSAEWQF
ncbi:MAG: IS66 family insertion sequence element accessory protein TnpB [Methylococcaceae bacterium]